MYISMFPIFSYSKKDIDINIFIYVYYNYVMCMYSPSIETKKSVFILHYGRLQQWPKGYLCPYV